MLPYYAIDATPLSLFAMIFLRCCHYDIIAADAALISPPYAADISLMMARLRFSIFHAMMLLRHTVSPFSFRFFAFITPRRFILRLLRHAAMLPFYSMFTLLMPLIISLLIRHCHADTPFY